MELRATPTTHSEAREQIDSPVYRVNFWSRPKPTYAWNLDAWVLEGMEDVAATIEWTQAKAGGRQFELFVEFASEDVAEGPRQTVLIRLYGSNPNVQ